MIETENILIVIGRILKHIRRTRVGGIGNTNISFKAYQNKTRKITLKKTNNAQQTNQICNYQCKYLGKQKKNL